jgi:Flp pilus assembly protein TadB
MSEKNTENYLFDSIKYESEEAFEKFTNSMTVEQAVFILSSAIQISHRHGIFNMDESEILNKAIRMLNKNIFSK